MEIGGKPTDENVPRNGENDGIKEGETNVRGDAKEINYYKGIEGITDFGDINQEDDTLEIG